MDQVVIFEDSSYRNLLPLVYWRACCELRCGYTSLLDKQQRTWAKSSVRLSVRPQIADVVAERLALPVNQAPGGAAVFVNGRLLKGLSPDQIAPGTYGVENGDVVYIAADAATAARLTPDLLLDAEKLKAALAALKQVECKLPKHGLMRYPWDLVHANEEELVEDWKRSGGAAIEGRLCDGTYVLNESAVYVGKGSIVKPCSVLDAEDGPIYIDDDVTISPNVTVQGPCYIGRKCLIQPTAMIREGTSLGEVCKVGGEVECSIIHGYSNKQHTGFLGHAYVCEWINLGAGCTNSDLKNTYGSVRVPLNGQKEIDSGETFVGMMVGDHSKTGINTAFATGSILGTCCNVFVSSHPGKFTPSFSWHTDKGLAEYDAKRGLEVARKVMGRRKKEVTPALEKLFLSLPQIAREHEAPAG